MSENLEMRAFRRHPYYEDPRDEQRDQWRRMIEEMAREVQDESRFGGKRILPVEVG